MTNKVVLIINVKWNSAKVKLSKSQTKLLHIQKWFHITPAQDINELRYIITIS